MAENTSQEVSSELTAEQQRRLEIFEKYNQIAGPARDARNTAIEAHDRQWREKAVQLFQQQEQRRIERMQELTAAGVAGPVATTQIAFEIAKETEESLIARDEAARKIDGELEKPKRWREYLMEEAERNPGDPVIATLLKENSALDHDLAVEGFSKSPAPERLLSELSMVEQDGATAFKRGLTTVFKDMGNRLDVQRVDDRDIEAALKVAAQKFDTEKGLLLTGDTAFKARAAEIAGRMGLKLRNEEPEVLAQWQKGLQQKAQLMPSVAPSVERGIAGDVREPGIDRVRGEQILLVSKDAAKEWGNQLEQAGVEFVAIPTKDGQIAIKLPGDRTQQALEAWRGTPYQTMQAFARADLSKPDGGLKLSEEDQKVLVHRQMLREDGTLTPAGVDVILVRDDQVLRSRVQPELKQVFAPGVELKTSHEFVRQMAGEIKADRTHQTAGEAMEKAKEQAQVKDLAKQGQEKDPLGFLDDAHGLGKDKAKEEEEREKEREEKEVSIAPVARPRRAKTMAMDIGR